MANNAILANGSAFKVKIATVLTKVSGISDFGGLLGGTPTVVDVSDLDSTSKDKLIGMMDEGQFTLSGNYVAADAGQGALIAGRSAGTKLDFAATIGAKTFSFSGYVLKFEVGATVDKQVPFSATIEITGSVVVA